MPVQGSATLISRWPQVWRLKPGDSGPNGSQVTRRTLVYVKDSSVLLYCELYCFTENKNLIFVHEEFDRVKTVA